MEMSVQCFKTHEPRGRAALIGTEEIRKVGRPIGIGFEL